MMKLRIGWKTIGGGLLQAIALCASPLVTGIIGVKVAGIIGAVGVVLEKFGVRSAIGHATSAAADAGDQAATAADRMLDVIASQRPPSSGLK